MKTLSVASLIGSLRCDLDSRVSAKQESNHAADCPCPILTSDWVRAKRLGKLSYFDGLPAHVTVKLAVYSISDIP